MCFCLASITCFCNNWCIHITVFILSPIHHAIRYNILKCLEDVLNECSYLSFHLCLLGQWCVRLFVCLCLMKLVLRKVQGLTGKTSSHTICTQQTRMEGLVTPERNLILFLRQVDIGTVEPFQNMSTFLLTHQAH